MQDMCISQMHMKPDNIKTVTRFFSQIAPKGKESYHC